MYLGFSFTFLQNKSSWLLQVGSSSELSAVKTEQRELRKGRGPSLRIQLAAGGLGGRPLWAR